VTPRTPSDRPDARILLIAGDPELARLVRTHLADDDFSCDLRQVESLDRARAVLGRESFDLCLLDLGLPDADEVRAVRSFRERAGDLPVVVMTGLDELDRAMAALRSGAREYLVRDGVTPVYLRRLLQVVLERDRARREHRALAERWSSLFEASPVAIVLSDAETGRLVEVNEAFAEMFGRSREELIGATSLDLGQWEDPERRRELLERVREQGYVEGEEAWFRDADGRRGRMRLACRRLTLSGGDRLLWTVQDITEVVAREHALRERVKEQTCLHDVSRILRDEERPFGDRLREVVGRIPAGWQYPEIAVARLRLEGEEYSSGSFDGVERPLESTLVMEGTRVGEVAVGYREDRPEEDLGPFLVEERRLLDQIADQIEAHLGRRKTRREMGHVVETMTEAVTIVAPDGTVTFTNSAARRLYGEPEPAYVGADITDFAARARRLDDTPLPPEDLPFQTVVRTGVPVTGYEHVIERADGKRIVVSVNAAPIRDDGGEIRGVVLSTRDVTAQHRAAEWRHLLQSSVEAAALGVVVTDREGRIVWTNPAFTRMTGYGAGEVRGENPRILRSGEHDEAFYEELWETILAGETWEGELVNRRKDGSLYRERQSIVPVRHRSDEITHFIALKADVTEEMEREERLRESETRYRTLVETMAEATVVLDDRGRITFANSEAEELLDLERSEADARRYGDPAWRIAASDGRPRPDSELPFRQVMETGEPVRDVVHAFTRSDGTRSLLSVNAAPMAHGPGQLEGVVATIRDVTEQKRLEAQLEHQALHDPLTGLANRTLLQDRLEQAVARSRRLDQPMGLLMLDIDGFKRINDSLGHTAGDSILVQVARRLERATRETDTAARWGGDEFVVVLPDLDSPAAIERVQTRIREAVEIPMSAGGEEDLEIHLTLGGVVRTDGDERRGVSAESPEELLRFADLALHRAKSVFAGGFYLFDPSDGIAEATDLRLEQELRRALRSDQIAVAYQPIRRLDDGSLWGVEALARWRHPEQGPVSPGEFVPLAERVGLIGELGRQVFRRGCRDRAAWGRRLPAASGLTLAFNLSARQLQDPELVERMSRWLDETGLPAEHVVVEITETALMKAPARVAELQELGAAVFIDDFGTGYSTFTYLRELDADGLKIDMSFVQSLPGSASDAAIVETIVTLAMRLGLRVIAEGIETEAQLRSLQKLGCPLGQGFLLGRPAPAGEIVRLLEG